MNITIISGRSGSGKSTALQALEDIGYYCVDNLPVALLTGLHEQLCSAASQTRSIAVGIDARNLPNQLQHLDEALQQLRSQQARIDVVFLDAEHDVLLKRFSATRRRHPLSNAEATLEDAIRKEALILASLRAQADLIIDTSTLDTHSLRDIIRQRVARESRDLSLVIESFGFKHGLPKDADLVFDVRVLPNPHWHDALRPLTGQDEDIIAFMQEYPQVTDMLNDIDNFVSRWLPAYENNDRNYMTIAIGCTGGRHRSVYIAEQLCARLRPQRPGLLLRHRDL